METLINLINNPIGIGITCFVLVSTMAGGWILLSYIAIKRGENNEYMSEKMKKMYYNDFMLKINGEIMEKEKYSKYLIKLFGNCILFMLIGICYVVLGLVAAVAIAKYYLWIGLIIGFVYWMVRKIVKKRKLKLVVT